MRFPCAVIAAVLFASLCPAAGAVPADQSFSVRTLYQRDLSRAEEAAVIAKYRSQGQPAVSRLLAEFRSLRGDPAQSALQDQGQDPAASGDRRFFSLLDQICAQRYCAQSGLFWHTDFKAAQDRSLVEQKPILVLTLLGDLRDELSCANSRFFRVLLYSDPAVSKLMREKYVLYWRAERKVPKVEIDFGDGRRLYNTITGNSIHYILDSRGRVIEALPGLSAPKQFFGGLLKAAQQARAVQDLEDQAFRDAIMPFHSHETKIALERFENDIKAAKLTAAEAESMRRLEESAEIPPAIRASMAATSKALMEAPLYRGIDSLGPAGSMILAQGGLWRTLGLLHKEGREISKQSEDFLRQMIGSYAESTLGAGGAPFDPRSYESLVVEDVLKNLQADSYKNEFDLHQTIRQYLITSSGVSRYEPMNKWIYSQLFSLPQSDPWYGLVYGQPFTAIAYAVPTEAR